MRIEQEAKQLAGQYFKSGFNCSEALLRAFRDVLTLELSEDALKMASGFGGGMGQAGCACGALSASIMVLGFLQGRTSSEQNRGPIYTAAKSFHGEFSDTFGGACCRALNTYAFGTKEQRSQCLRITEDTAELLMKYISEEQLLRHK